MKIVKTKEEVRAAVKEWKAEGLTVGFVPTMGYLHEGHASLMKLAGENDRVVVSIFVNPMQFGPNEDLASYPRDLERDSSVCEEQGVDLIFNPEPEEMYPQDFSSFVDMTGPTEELCGSSRPGHFKGVCTVVNKLFNIVKPDKAYFGQKDAQQFAVIKRMVRDLDMDLEVVAAPIIREEDGLAKSSRNKYLNKEEREAALILSRSLQLGRDMLEAGETDVAAIVKAIEDKIKTEPLAKIDYVKIVDASSIKPVETVKEQVLVAMAVYIGKTRLIDNFIFEK
ncbi:pantoate--beta-alanine ligase [Anaerobium acetethylicum]|uniref:Pantothenate synthetase n=1 Tax=Anaerobium acetethylicum TaxID=1619234 RepID=A0A1D3TQ94_9FIRM|nr:pantoate--beta-alanine ligase [Anaerobium acetethylicum]SCP95637.1 pantoate--beta-alanine ligase [Anaerobium acetethylicum]